MQQNLGVYGGRNPPYASAIFIELHEMNGDSVVKVSLLFLSLRHCFAEENCLVFLSQRDEFGIGAARVAADRMPVDSL